MVELLQRVFIALIERGFPAVWNVIENAQGIAIGACVEWQAGAVAHAICGGF